MWPASAELSFPPSLDAHPGHSPCGIPEKLSHLSTHSLSIPAHFPSWGAGLRQNSSGHVFEFTLRESRAVSAEHRNEGGAFSVELSSEGVLTKKAPPCDVWTTEITGGSLVSRLLLHQSWLNLQGYLGKGSTLSLEVRVVTISQWLHHWVD